MTEKIKRDPVRAAVYFDGFNLYFGMRQQRWRKYYWLDIWACSESLVNDRQLVAAKYFTADVSGSGGKVQRQQTYLNALLTHQPNLEIIKGKYLRKTIDCPHCVTPINRSEEKMTDVNIATHLLNDAWKDVYDVAIIVSGDSDLVPPIATVRAEFPNKRILVAFPPNRVSRHLKQTTTTFHINEKAFKNCQLPPTVTKADGSQLHRPPSWS